MFNLRQRQLDCDAKVIWYARRAYVDNNEETAP